MATQNGEQVADVAESLAKTFEAIRAELEEMLRTVRTAIEEAERVTNEPGIHAAAEQLEDYSTKFQELEQAFEQAAATLHKHAENLESTARETEGGLKN